MPGFDQTGPAGYGPGTGRGLGPCGSGRAYGRGMTRARGFRQGSGGGFGRGFCWYNIPAEPLSDEAQKELLEAELRRIEAEKIEIQRRLNDLA
ncbi:MAG: DUF5320 domain-containing protein [Methanospirillum sp.]|nr:DUF5320 domain-containing protein [Methanospirillum sp.]